MPYCLSIMCLAAECKRRKNFWFFAIKMIRKFYCFGMVMMSNHHWTRRFVSHDLLGSSQVEYNLRCECDDERKIPGEVPYFACWQKASSDAEQCIMNTVMSVSKRGGVCWLSTISVLSFWSLVLKLTDYSFNNYLHSLTTDLRQLAFYTNVLSLCSW